MYQGIWGRPKKLTHPGGRPSFLPTSHLLCCQQYPDLYSFTSYRQEVVPCKSLICCSCLLGHLDKDSDMFRCPGCSEEHTNTESSFTKMSPVAEKMMNKVKCNKCYRPVKPSISKKPCDHHVNESDRSHQSSTGFPATTMEKQVASSVVAAAQWQAQ